MNQSEVSKIYTSLTNSFNSAGRLDETHAREWAFFLKDQDYKMAKEASDYFCLHSGATWMPTIAEFNKRISELQSDLSAKEALKKDSLACPDCGGETWMFDLGNAIPCPSCRSSSYARWEEQEYNLGAPLHMDEIDGPKQTYQIAAKPRFNSGHDVSADRANQWREHILSGSPEPYPESETKDKIKSKSSGSTHRPISSMEPF